MQAITAYDNCYNPTLLSLLNLPGLLTNRVHLHLHDGYSLSFSLQIVAFLKYTTIYLFPTIT